MLNFLLRNDVSNKMIGLITLNCGIICYLNWRISQKYEKMLQKVSKAPIYEFEEFMQIQKQRNSSLQSVQGKDEFYLVKMKPPSQSFMQSQQNIYSNQISFCPPSINFGLKDTLKQYQKDFKAKLKDNYLLFPAEKILTDKLSYETTYTPRPQTEIGPDDHIILRFGYFLWIKGQKIYEKIEYFSQLILEKLEFRKNRKRSNNKNRSPLIKGVLKGVLYSQFSYLAGSNFLLKINIQGSQFRTILIADNKLMIMEFYSIQINKFNRFMLLAATLTIGGLSYILYKYSPWLKLYWRQWTKNNKQLNPQGFSDDKLCQICYTNCRNVVFFRCRHLIVCEGCYWHLDKKKCIVCNQQISKTQFIYPLK